MVRIKVDKVCKIDQFKHFSMLRKSMRIMDPNRFYDPGFKNGRWDGSYKFVGVDGKFNLGLIYDVIRFVKKMGHKIELGIHPRFKIKQYALRRNMQLANPNKNLRDYQIQARNIMDRRVIGAISLPTSAGKTEIILDWMRCHPNANGLYLCTKVLLARQTQERAEDYLGENVTLLCGGNGVTRHGLERLTVGVDKTVANLIKRRHIQADAFDIIFVDECQHAKAKTVSSIIEFLNWKRCFGFTGSYPTEKYNLVAHWAVKESVGPPIFVKEDKELASEFSEYFPTTYVHRITNQLESRRFSYVTGAAIYQMLKRDYDRNRLIANVSSQLGCGVLIVVNHSDHGETLEKMLREQFKCNAKFIDAKKGRFVCQDQIKRLDRGELDVLIATPVIDEGISVNNIRHIVMAAGFKSELQVIQRVGRGRRKKSRGKNVLHIWDFADEGQKNCVKNSRQRFQVYKRVTDNIEDVSVFGVKELIYTIS